mmetsp:Transcript_31848/g.54320  ORF Transcript_31848/g.54320 Transcript_31848/m.54320 type:complete len:87 (-) Transcript_31848:247-507(-)
MIPRASSGVIGGSGLSLSMYWKKNAWWHLVKDSSDVGDNLFGSGILSNFRSRRISYGSSSVATCADAASECDGEDDNCRVEKMVGA